MLARKRSLSIGKVAILASSLSAFAVLPFESSAFAEESVLAKEPRMLDETAEITSVVDAFDKGDPFDLHLRVGFEQTWKHSNIRRETQLAQPGLATGGFIPANENIASYSEQRSTLNLGADIGLYQDLALILRMPIILSDTQGLKDLNGSTSAASYRLADPASPTGVQLFSVPFTSPTRSGLDWIGIGLDWGIFNQQRDPTKPTWVVGVETRFSIGTPMAACNNNGPTGGLYCPNPQHDVDSSAGTGVSGGPGVSRATDAIRAHTIVSKRIAYAEPYIGFWFQAEIPQTGRGAWQYSAGAPGVLLNMPPLEGTFGTGVELIPYERKEQFQRVTADFRVLSTYHSPGREYTELFDALGSSTAPSLRTPNPWQYTSGGQQDTSHPGVPFTGLTDQTAYISAGASASMTWQAGEYIKFQAGVGFQYNQNHLITAADPCNPSISGLGGAGPCTNPNSATTVTGIPNPNHFAVIDTPGRRFAAEDTTLVNLWITGVVMF